MKVLLGSLSLVVALVFLHQFASGGEDKECEIWLDDIFSDIFYRDGDEYTPALIMLQLSGYSLKESEDIVRKRMALDRGIPSRYNEVSELRVSP